MEQKKDLTNILKQAFDKVLMDKYGYAVPPEPLITPFGIKHLDCLLGGGLTSSSPLVFSSTPETGKSTLALQFAATFQQSYDNAVVTYLNVEEAAGVSEDSSLGINDRIVTFGINTDHFLHKPVMLNVKEMFELISQLIDLKQTMQDKTGKQYQVLFVLDSIAAVPSSKDAEAEDPNAIIGFKARELTFNLNKYKSRFAMNQVSFIMIDQVRSNISQAMQTVWQKAATEKSVGSFGNFQAATNVNALNHCVRQWLFLSKGKTLKPTDPMNVDGWVLNIFTEKNKLAPSQYSVAIVFDKKFGCIPFWSEYLFLSEKTKTERKYWPLQKPLNYPLSIIGEGGSRILKVIEPSTGSILYQSDKFKERQALAKYNSDETFRSWFDKAMDIAVEQRITVNLFRSQPTEYQVEDPDTPTQIAEQTIDNALADQEFVPVELDQESEQSLPEQSKDIDLNIAGQLE